MDKKAISELVTAILIILLVLGAIVIVWAVVRGTVEKGATEIEQKAECIGVSLTIEDVVLAANAITVTVSRGADSVGDATNGDELIVTALCKDGTSKSVTGAPKIKALGTQKAVITCGTDNVDTSTVVQTGVKIGDAVCEGVSGTYP